MKIISKLIAATAIMVFCSLTSFAQVNQVVCDCEPTDEEFEYQALMLEWSVVEDYGYTLKGYPVTNMMDRNPATAWAGDLDAVDDDGKKYFDESKVYGDGLLGFKIKVKGSRVAYLEIIAGYAKSASTFRNNSAPTRIAIYDGKYSMNDGGEFVDSEGNCVEPLASRELKRTTDYQIVELDPALEGSDTLWFVIYDIERGTRYNDLCISELNFFGRL